jgi:hypothetical protein
MLTRRGRAWFNVVVGMLSDPYDQSEDDGLEISLSGLPEDPEDPELPEGVEAVAAEGPEEPEGDFDDEVEDLRERSKSDDLLADELDLSDDAATDTDADTADDDADLGGAVVAADADADESDEDEDGDSDEDDDEAELAYDLAEWDNDQLDMLFAALHDSQIDYVWDGSELFVRAEDEQGVDDVIERIDSEISGDGGGQLLGDLFVVADELQHDPDAHESVARLLKLANAADEADAPYGLDDKVWEGMRERVTAVATLLEDEKPDGDEVIAAAGELRLAIRPYV